MGLRPSSLLVLVLCLGQTVHMQNRVLPKPSIRSEPGPVIRRGQPVTIVCLGPAWAELFRLVDENVRKVLPDQTNVSQRGLHWAQATFHIKAVSGDTAGSYRCLYNKGPSWSDPSEILELKVTEEDVSTLFSVPGTASEVTPPPTGPVSQTAPSSQNYTVGNYVCMGLAGVVLLILVGILAEAAHSRHRWPHRPQEWTQLSSCQRN
ncbi:leukocyte-associated immunoglobulin-like receptor 2 isoform X1 [Artibeus jamaicensis]|uniref:leukocyte-associated immunoglobulin-like receptor 2 isoform X1 n=1 Tax=Artibeus jamaicensis TaxID=9417 RepID=UPI00235B0F39|nr:leukocyte-associated immunoglobulin-like receptor 2 isoform X1 [Artibeus jamaicensis]